MNPIIDALTEQLQDNVGNRITAALANGILLAVSQVIRAGEQEAQAAPAPAFGEQAPAAPTADATKEA